MNKLNTLRKIRGCDGEAAALLLLESLLDEKLRSERKKMWEQINQHIIKGHLDGNGCDETAQRNGLILATNIIFSFGI
jgi:hypothetical protein